MRVAEVLEWKKEEIVLIFGPGTEGTGKGKKKVVNCFPIVQSFQVSNQIFNLKKNKLLKYK